MMITDELYIKWDRGSMTIFMDKFFPCPKADFKKLLKIIDLDWGNNLELREKLKVYFQNKIPECQSGFEHSGKEYLKYKQLEADTRLMVANKKRPNGLPLSEDEVKAERMRAGQYATCVASYLRMAKGYERNKKKFQELLNLL